MTSGLSQDPTAPERSAAPGATLPDARCFRAAFAATPIGMACVSLQDGRFISVNPALCALLGRPATELLGQPLAGFLHPDDHSTFPGNAEIPGASEHYFCHADGSGIWMRLTLARLDDAGAADIAVVTFDNFTERRERRLALALAVAEARQAFLLAFTDRLRPLADPRQVMQAAAEMLARHLGAPRAGYGEYDAGEQTLRVAHGWTDETLPGRPGAFRMADFGPGKVERLRAGQTMAVSDITTTEAYTSNPTVAATYDALGIRASLAVPLVKGGQLLALAFVHHAVPHAWTRDEITLVETVCARTWAAVQRGRAEADLAASEATLRAIADALPQVVWACRPDGSVEFRNRRFEEFTGDDPADHMGWLRAVHPEDRERTDTRWRHSRETGEPYEIEYRMRHRDGSWRWALGRAVPVRNAEGEIIRWIGFWTDLQDLIAGRDALALSRAELERIVNERTIELRQANEQLRRETREREAAQAALFQSQKLEALGQLTSGVAHDFNNVIAAIAGGFSVIERRSDDERVLEVARHGARAAWRGAALVRQLLAFARQQALVPAEVDLGALLTEIEELLGRAAGPMVRLVLELPADLWRVMVDASQLQAALINLAANARDAMAQGGELAIGARRCPADEPGRPPQLEGQDAVAISVRDTGCGMTPEVLQRVTEPFFTTKGPGKGTGLGLAMVHGFAVQSGGALRLESRPGQGTTITLFLPRADGGAVLAEPDHGAIAAGQHGDAVILVVDDDEAVRGVTAVELRDLGYTVVEAESAEAALAVLHLGQPIDLVLSDVMMPGMSGTALATAIRGERPAMPILFMTGYAERIRLAGEAVIEKPFTAETLALQVLRLLGRADPRAASEAALDRLSARMRSDWLRRLLARWRAARGTAALPTLGSFDLAAEGDAERLAVVHVDMGRLPIGFRLEQVGSALIEASGQALEGSELTVAGEEALGSHEAAYRRSARSARPSYEYARFGLDDGPPALFERLLLPFSDNNTMVTSLVAAVVIAGTSRREPEIGKPP